LDRTLAWKVLVFEAQNETAPGKDFKEIIHTKIDPIRQ
jgi:hypothetical protein